MHGVESKNSLAREGVLMLTASSKLGPAGRHDFKGVSGTSHDSLTCHRAQKRMGCMQQRGSQCHSPGVHSS